MFRGGPIDILGLLSELREVFEEAPLQFATNAVNRYNEIRDFTFRKGNTSERYFDYFREARKCYVVGSFKPCVLMALAALECCLRSDYFLREQKIFGRRLVDLLDLYFTEKRLPTSHQGLSDIARKVRNDITHPGPGETFAVDKPTAQSVMGIVFALIDGLTSR